MDSWVENKILAVGGAGIGECGGVGERDAGTPNFAESDESYHGIIHTRGCAVAPLVMKVRIELARACPCLEVSLAGCLYAASSR